MFRIGLISDTHGLLRPEAVAFLRGCDRIIHAGDIGGMDILRELGALAPVTAIRGNNDTEAQHQALPETAHLHIGRWRLHVLHDLKQLTIDPRMEGVHCVICGHSHKPLAEQRDNVWFVNPGSAGPRRFRLPIAVGEVMIEAATLTPRLVELDI